MKTRLISLIGLLAFFIAGSSTVAVPSDSEVLKAIQAFREFPVDYISKVEEIRNQEEEAGEFESKAPTSEPLHVGETPYPSHVDGIEWQFITNYAARNPTAGIGFGYRSPTVKADIYVYDAGNASQSHLPLEERLSQEFEKFPEGLREMERRGHYAGITITEKDEVIVGTLRFKRYEMTYKEKSTPKKSRFYLGTFGNQLLKIRITAVESVPDQRLDQIFADAVALYQSKFPDPAFVRANPHDVL